MAAVYHGQQRHCWTCRCNTQQFLFFYSILSRFSSIDIAYIDGLVPQRRNPSASAMELLFSCTYPLISYNGRISYYHIVFFLEIQLLIHTQTSCDIIWCLNKLDESTARRQLKSPQSLPGRSIHLTLVTKWSWSWSLMTFCHLLCAMSISPPILKYNYFKILPWKSMVMVICVVKGQGHIWHSKFKGQGYGQVQTHWSHMRPGVQSICLLFVSRQSDHFWLRYSKLYIWPWKFKVKVMAKVKPDGHIWALVFNRYVSICLLFVSWQSDHFWLRYSKFYIWPWKFKVKVMAKVKPDGHIWAPVFNRYVCFLFRGNPTIFDWNIANSIFDLENSRSRSWPRSNLMVTFEP